MATLGRESVLPATLLVGTLYCYVVERRWEREASAPTEPGHRPRAGGSSSHLSAEE